MIINEVRFNTYENDGTLPSSRHLSGDPQSSSFRTMTPLPITDFRPEEYASKPKNDLPVIQCFTAGYRVSRLDEDTERKMASWNRCAIVDVDIKQYIEHECEYAAHLTSPGTMESLEQNLHKALTENGFIYNLLWEQRSASGFGFHFCFWFADADLTMDDYRHYNELAHKAVVNAFWLLSPGHEFYNSIVEHDKAYPSKMVFDPHGMTNAGLIAMSAQPLNKASDAYQQQHHFGRTAGYRHVAELEAWSPENAPETAHKTVAPTKTVLSADVSKAHTHDGSNTDVGWSNEECFKLSTVLKYAFPDNMEAAEALFTSLLTDIRRTRKSGERTILKEFRDNYKRAKPENINKVPLYMLRLARRLFGIQINIQQDEEEARRKLAAEGRIWKPLDFLATDNIELAPDQYISDYTELIKSGDHRYTYIKAPCGSGKTQYIIRSFKTDEKAIIVCHLNSLKKSNYANSLLEKVKGEDEKQEIEVKVILETNLLDETVTKKESAKTGNPKPSSKRKTRSASTPEIARMIERGELHDHMLLGWRQFGEILLSEKAHELLRGFTVYVDEAHALETTWEYRGDQILPIITNIKKCGRLELFSATPQSEASIIFGQGDRVRYIEFDKPEPFTTEVFYLKPTKDAGSPYATIAEYAKSVFLNRPPETTKVAVYVNDYHTALAKSLLKHFEFEQILDFNRSNTDDEAVRDVLRTNRVPQNVLVSTAYGCEGIEFKEQQLDELFVVVPTQSTIQLVDVQQFANRWRHKKHLNIIFVQTKMAGTDFELMRYISDYSSPTKTLTADGVVRPDWFDNLHLRGHRYVKQATKIDLRDVDTDNLDEQSRKTIIRMINMYTEDRMKGMLTFENIQRRYPEIKVYEAEYSTDLPAKTDYSNLVKDVSADPEKYMCCPPTIRAIRELLDQAEMIEYQAPKNYMSVEEMFDLKTVSLKEQDRRLHDKAYMNKAREIIRILRATAWRFGAEKTVGEDGLAYIKRGNYTQNLLAFIRSFYGNDGLIDISTIERFVGCWNGLGGAISEKQVKRDKGDSKWMGNKMKKLGLEQFIMPYIETVPKKDRNGGLIVEQVQRYKPANGLPPIYMIEWDTRTHTKSNPEKTKKYKYRYKTQALQTHLVSAGSEFETEEHKTAVGVTDAVMVTAVEQKYFMTKEEMYEDWKALTGKTNSFKQFRDRLWKDVYEKIEKEESVE